MRTTKTQIDSVGNMEEVVIRAADKNKKDEQIILPGFRFHPTDEELVGFYLRRKVERKPLKIELIMQVDIYKYDPWDLPVTKVSSTGDKEYYFFCIRGRKYRNSVRPNRVTGSGFWKATGIDKPIHSTGETTECIGLKKSLVYYRGSAGKGTKTDWMMHEFRLPPDGKKSNQPNAMNLTQELEDWSLCRIFQRNASHKRYKPALKQTSTQQSFAGASSKSCSLESEISDQYTSFEELALQQQKINAASAVHMNQKSRFYGSHDQSLLVAQSSYSSSNSNYWNPNGSELFRDGKWDELSSVVDSASDPTIFYGYYR